VRDLVDERVPVVPVGVGEIRAIERQLGRRVLPEDLAVGDVLE
jgi:hypothetical protein